MNVLKYNIALKYRYLTPQKFNALNIVPWIKSFLKSAIFFILQWIKYDLITKLQLLYLLILFFNMSIIILDTHNFPQGLLFPGEVPGTDVKRDTGHWSQPLLGLHLTHHSTRRFSENMYVHATHLRAFQQQHSPHITKCQSCHKALDQTASSSECECPAVFTFLHFFNT